jgi:hypothetical protein
MMPERGPISAHNESVGQKAQGPYRFVGNNHCGLPPYVSTHTSRELLHRICIPSWWTFSWPLACVLSGYMVYALCNIWLNHPCMKQFRLRIACSKLQKESARPPTPVHAIIGCSRTNNGGRNDGNTHDLSPSVWIQLDGQLPRGEVKTTLS